MTNRERRPLAPNEWNIGHWDVDVVGSGKMVSRPHREVPEATR